MFRQKNLPTSAPSWQNADSANPLRLASIIKGLSSDVLPGPENGLEHPCAASTDNILTVPQHALARAIINAYDLTAPLPHD